MLATESFTKVCAFAKLSNILFFDIFNLVVKQVALSAKYLIFRFFLFRLRLRLFRRLTGTSIFTVWAYKFHTIPPHLMDNLEVVDLCANHF